MGGTILAVEYVWLVFWLALGSGVALWAVRKARHARQAEQQANPDVAAAPARAREARERHDALWH